MFYRYVFIPVGASRWYVGNIQTCATRGMRLPTMYETATSVITHSYYPTDASPTFAQSTGVPVHPAGEAWTATSHSYNFNTNGNYFSWTPDMSGNSSYGSSYAIRCVLP